MKKNIVKTKMSTIALILVLTLSAIVVAFPTVNAHTLPANIPTFAYINAAPDPVGINQPVVILVWLDKIIGGANINNDIRFHDYELTITKPDGNTETIEWPIVYDTTSSHYTVYYPDQIGTYTLEFNYPGQVYTWTDPIAVFGPPMPNTYTNDTYLPSSATTTLTVQEEQLPQALSSYPLPTEYWTRPIEGENTDWYQPHLIG